MKITASDITPEDAAKVYEAIEALEFDYKIAGVYNSDKRKLTLYLLPYDD